MKKIYICTPLSQNKFDLSEISKQILKEKVFAFIPPSEQLFEKKLGSSLDKMMIENCDEVWVFGEIGRDCAWEIGYAQGLNKNVIFHVNNKNKHILEEDWMVTINLTIKKLR